MRFNSTENFNAFRAAHSITINADMGGSSWKINVAGARYVLVGNAQRADVPAITDELVDLSLFTHYGEQLAYAERITWAEAHAFICGLAISQTGHKFGTLASLNV